jgi:hypothetical protein
VVRWERQDSSNYCNSSVGSVIYRTDGDFRAAIERRPMIEAKIQVS